jgi:hypothetical protein
MKPKIRKATEKDALAALFGVYHSTEAEKQRPVYRVR